jgi:hypothetical protein
MSDINILTERLESLAESLESCEWNHPITATSDVREAINKICSYFELQNNQFDEAKERKRFEAWIKKSPYENDCRQYDVSDEVPWSGQYIQYSTQLAWEAWCERAKEAGSDVVR